MRLRSAALVGVLALLLAACPQDTEPVGVEEPAEEPAEDAEDDGEGATEAEDDEEGEPAEEATVETADSDLGTILVDADGMTLYLFDNDSPGESTCYDDCATNWPPLEAEDPVAGEGVDGSLLGTIERDDGTVQVTYGEMPLYLFAGDASPGETNGQGINDVWWAVDPDGEAIRDGDEGASGY